MGQCIWIIEEYVDNYWCEVKIVSSYILAIDSLVINRLRISYPEKYGHESKRRAVKYRLGPHLEIMDDA